MNPYKVVQQFEKEIADYAGSNYAVAVESCSAAIFLCLQLLKASVAEGIGDVSIPKHTYPSVPCSVIHAGGTVVWRDEDWKGVYQLEPYRIVDGALRFKREMFQKGTLHCLSFHSKKHLPIGRGGMILADNLDTYEWLKRARFDGRNETTLDKDVFTQLGWNAYMTPEQAIRGLELFNIIKDKDLPDLEQTYPDLSQFPIYDKAL